MKQLLWTGIPILFLVACSGNQGELVDLVESDESSETVVQAPAPTEPPTADASEVNNPRPVLVPGPELDTPDVDGEDVTAAGITFVVDPMWSTEPPASRMRAVQYSLPPADGDEEPGELVLFAGFMGPADQNIQRWIGQIQNPTSEPEVATYTVNGFNVTALDAKGTYATSTGGGPMMGGTPIEMEGYRMLAAVVSHGEDYWYWKLTGPEATLERWKPSFEALIQSMKRS